MSELLDKAKVIHDKQSKKITFEQFLEKEEKDRLISSRRIKDFVELMKEHNMPSEIFCTAKPYYCRGWIVQFPSRYDYLPNDSIKFLPGIAIMEDLTTYEWGWTERDQYELIEKSLSTMYFSQKRHFTILCERVIDLGIVG